MPVSDPGYSPRENDHLVEPMLVGIHAAHDESGADEGGAGGSDEETRLEVDPFGRSGARTVLRDGFIPSPWLWIPMVGIAAGLLWLAS